jgi:HEAT repeat protein
MTPGGLDLTTWQVWWEHNRGAYLDLDAVFARIHPPTGAPAAAGAADAGRRAGVTDARLAEEVLPALRAALDADPDALLEHALALALARIGVAPGESDEVTALLAARLDDGQLAVREGAVVALGVLGTSDACDHLAALLADARPGRRLVSAASVPTRTRALAAQALGVAAARSEQDVLARFAAHHLVRVLRERAGEPDLVLAACLVGLGLAAQPLDVRERAETVDAWAAEVELLLELLDAPRLADAVRAQVPVTLARLVQADSVLLKSRVARRLIAAVGPRSREDRALQRGAVLALGRLGDGDEDDVDHDIRRALQRAMDGRDGVLRGFAALALGECSGRPGHGAGDALTGGRETAIHLARTLERTKSQLKPWIGLALGVLGHGLAREGVLMRREGADALLALTGDARAPERAGAYAVGAGLAGDARAVKPVVERFARLHERDLRGDVAVALGLLGDRGALDPLRRASADALHDPELLVGAAIGRALLGDQTVVPTLLAALDGCDCVSARYAVLRALAWTGDGRALAPLLEILSAPSSAAHERAFAAEALGWIGDRHPGPWSSRVSAGLHYLAAPVTWSDPLTGMGMLEHF